MIRINDIIHEASSFLSAADKNLLQKAYVFSAAAHANQIRLSGEPYLSHPLEVAYILAKMKMDVGTICAGLLHDTVEDSSATVEELTELFGEDVARIVDGVTKISKINFVSREEAQAENIRKMILAMADDLRVIIVKLADRLHNMSTLEFQKEHKQRAIARETLDIYAPLANRLGLYRVKVDLEDLSLKYLKPDVYSQIGEEVKMNQTAGADYISLVCKEIEDLLRENNIEGSVAGRVKHINSIYHKMVSQDLELDQIYDIIAFRIRVESVKECYAVFGLIHSLWRPVPGKIKDYISMPKSNMYQSLHTTVIGPNGERIEIQIRTHEMHRYAEYGVAAHWLYKEGSKLKAKDASTFAWLRQILDWQEEMKDPREFMQALRIDLFEEEVYVYTPGGDVKELPEGSTPVDFAYSVHTEIGNRCAGAKVNGNLVPLNTVLQHGDTVEIIKSKSRQPSRDWLLFVKTAKAKTHIRQWIRTEERALSINLAREIMEKEARKVGINFVQRLNKGDLDEVAGKFSLQSADELLVAIGNGRVTPRQVLNIMQPPEPGRRDAKEVGKAPQSAQSKQDSSVFVSGLEDAMIRLASCCDPLPGDPIIGYISRGRGVTVHTLDCPNVKNMEPERLIDVTWGNEKEQPFPARVHVTCKNEKGILAKIVTSLAQEDINLQEGSFKSNVDGQGVVDMQVEVASTSHLYATLDKLAKIKGVTKAIRVTTG